MDDRHYLLVAKAAELGGERLLYALEAELIGAYSRFLDNPAKKDPGCTAKGAIARALIELVELLHDPEPHARCGAARAIACAEPLGAEAVLRAAVLHRSEAAFDWLISVAEQGDRTSAELVLVELAVYRANHKLRLQLQTALDRRRDERLLSRFEEIWGADDGYTARGQL